MSSVVTKFAPYILSVVIAILGFLSGATSDIGEAVQIALNKDKAIAQAAAIINEVPKKEVAQAIKDEPVDINVK